jgi:tetratricopeptide (TPR) repeat protein
MFDMKWKLSPLIILACCLATATAVAVRSQPARRGFSLIAVPTEREAVALRARIQSGASFEAIAMIYSTDPSAARWGYLGVVDESSLSREFQAALKDLKPGAVSAVTRVGGRFVLLKAATIEEDRWRLQQDNAAGALQQGRYPEAASLFLDAAQQAEEFGIQDVRLAESLNGLAQVYRYQQNHAAAETRARQALAILERDLGPSHGAVIPSLVHLAGITAATGRYEEAEQVYRRILSLRWGSLITATTRSIRSFLPGSGLGADQVLENFAEVLSLDLTRDPGLKSALDKYWRSISDSSLSKDLYVAMRDGLVAARLMEEAESLMRHAVKAYPDSRQIQLQLAELYLIWGKYPNAIEAFESAASRGASADPGVERQQRGMIYTRIGELNFYLVRFDEAIACLTKALEINPASWNPRLLLGTVYLRRNRFEEATEEYSHVISENSRIAAAHEGLAQVNLELGRYTESAMEAERALDIDPGLQSSRYIKAMALIRGDKEREGRIALQDYQQRESEQRVAASQLIAIAELEKNCSALLSEARLQEAMAMLSEGIREYPLHARLYLKLGLTQSRLGLHREAAETFETMIRMQLDDFLVHRQLAREYEQLGNEEGSRQQRVLYLQRYDAALQTKTN